MLSAIHTHELKWTLKFSLDNMDLLVEQVLAFQKVGDLLAKAKIVLKFWCTNVEGQWLIKNDTHPVYFYLPVMLEILVYSNLFKQAKTIY